MQTAQNRLREYERTHRKSISGFWTSGLDIREVQHLFGHASMHTSESYIKGSLPATMRANEPPIICARDMALME